MKWEATEDGESMSGLPALLPAGWIEARELIEGVVRARPDRTVALGDLSWEYFKDSFSESYELWWLPADHGPTVDLRIRLEGR